MHGRWAPVHAVGDRHAGVRQMASETGVWPFAGQRHRMPAAGVKPGDGHAVKWYRWWDSNPHVLANKAF